MVTETTLERAEELAESLLPDRTPKRRMLVIVNPYATTVSDRLRNLVVYALGSRYAVEAIDTQEQGHATQICREAAERGLRRGRGIRRRRHRERGGQRPRRLGHAADGAARRIDERLGAHARNPERRGRRHRAPAADGRRVAAATRRPRPRERARLRLLGGRGPGRERGRARGFPPAQEGALRRLVLQLRRYLDLQPQVPREPARRSACAPASARSRA